MAARLLKFETESGELLVEIPSPPGMVAPVGRLEDSVEAIRKSLTESLRVVSTMSSTFRRVFDEAEADSAEVELGLQFTAKGSVYVVETSGEASLKVTLKYNRR